MPQNKTIKPALKGQELLKFWVKFVMAVQRMFKRMCCGNAQCVNLSQGKLPAPQCFYGLRRHDCRCVYNSIWRYLWKHYNVSQNGDPTDYMNSLLSKIYNNTSCAICMEDLGESNLSKCSNKVCKYFFHNHCILQWFSKNNSCPCCRSLIVE